MRWRGSESVTIENRGSTLVDLDGWWLRDSSYHGDLARGYEFPRGTVLPAGANVVLHTAHGIHLANQYYWNLDKPVFDNVTGAPGLMADGAYLFDPQGDLRAAHQYSPVAPIHFP